MSCTLVPQNKRCVRAMLEALPAASHLPVSFSTDSTPRRCHRVRKLLALLCIILWIYVDMYISYWPFGQNSEIYCALECGYLNISFIPQLLCSLLLQIVCLPIHYIIRPLEYFPNVLISSLSISLCCTKRDTWLSCLTIASCLIILVENHISPFSSDSMFQHVQSSDLIEITINMSWNPVFTTKT